MGTKILMEGVAENTWFTGGLRMNSRKDIVNLDINEIIKYFKRYSNPMNMFILPKEIGGLGEIQEFIDEQKYSR